MPQTRQHRPRGHDSHERVRLSEPADMVRMKDGRIVSLDHRRLWAAARAGVKQVSARVHDDGDTLSAATAGRFAIGKDEVPTGTNPVTSQGWKAGDKPKTWGDADLLPGGTPPPGG